jgi:Family of unknown function (DUF6152)
MARKLATATVVAAVLMASGATLGAHHSHAMFDMTREVSVTGTVTAYAYRNPHVFLYIDVKADDGTVQNWAVEMSNISNMESRGIYLSTFKPGDTITVKLNPLRDGRPGGNYTSVVAADGKKYD